MSSKAPTQAVTRLLRQLRAELGYSQLEWAKLLLTSQPAVSTWECGNALPTRRQIQVISSRIPLEYRAELYRHYCEATI